MIHMDFYYKLLGYISYNWKSFLFVNTKELQYIEIMWGTNFSTIDLRKTQNFNIKYVDDILVIINHVIITQLSLWFPI